MEPILKLDSLHKAFGGLKVTDDVSFSIQPGEISAIIGPNGAGKTTLFNEITGYLSPDKGSVFFEGQNLTGMRPQEIVWLGVGRSFQIASIFQDETVLDNVKIACFSRLGQDRDFFKDATAYGEAKDRAYSILESLGLENKAHRLAYELAHGDQKLLDIGIALALEPKLLLLDEPTAGMSPDERRLTRELIQKLWEEYQLTLLFIEHDMDTVFGIAQLVRVLQQGSLLAEGTPDEIRNNQRVITAYLGEEL